MYSSISLHGDVEILMEKYVPLITQKEKSNPPSPHLIKEVKLEGKANDESLELLMKIEITILEENWKKISLFQTKNTILSYEIEKKSSEAFIGVFDDKVSLLASSNGTFLINLKLSVPYEKSQKKEVNLDLPAALKNSLKLEYKGKNLNLKPSAYQEGDFFIFSTTNKLTISWEKEVIEKIEEKIPKEVLVEKIEEKSPLAISNIYLLHQIGEGLVKTKGLFKYTINQSSIISLSIKVQNFERPFRVTNVSVRDLLKWEYEKNIIEIHFKKRMEGNINLWIDTDLEMKGTSCQVNVPIFTSINDCITRENGELGIVARTNVEINPLSGKFLNPIDSMNNEISPFAERPILFSFKYLEKDYQLELDVIRHDDTPILSCIIDVCRYQITQSDQNLIHQIKCTVKNTSKQFLRFQIDQGSEVWSTTVQNKTVKPVSEKNQDGTTNILIPISFGESKIVFTFKTISSLSSYGKIHFIFARVDAPINLLRVSLFLPQNYHYGEFEGIQMKEVMTFSKNYPNPKIIDSILNRDYNINQFSLKEEKKEEKRKDSESLVETPKRPLRRRTSIEMNRRTSIDMNIPIMDELNELKQAFKKVDSSNTVGVKPITVGSLKNGQKYRLERFLVLENEKLIISVEYKEMTKSFFERRTTDSSTLIYISLIVLLIGIIYYYVIIQKFFK